jgi:branched-chain amino acid transport system ATP-binding protein
MIKLKVPTWVINIIKHMNNIILKLENIDAGYKDLQVLFNVSLYINKGEVVALLGQNGAGKSTILKLIMGLIEKNAGRITRSQSISYVPQGKRVFPNLTVEENVLVRGIAKEIPEDLYLIFPILKTKSKVLAKNLSGGEQQMVALARALIDNPEVLLLDEPSLGLSPKFVQDIFKVIDKMRRERNLSVLVIEHNLISLLKIADRGYVLEKGSVIEELGSKDFQSKEAVYEAIMGR